MVLRLFLQKILAKVGNQRAKFLVAGGYNTAVGFIFTNLLLYFIDGQYVIFTLVGVYFLQLLHNFFIFEKFVFKSGVGFVSGIIKLNNSYIVIMSLQLLAVSVLVYLFKINDNIAYSIMFPILLILQYLLHINYTFKDVKTEGSCKKN